MRRVETAREMLAACEAALPADVAVCAAAVADWRVAEAADQKIKKQAGADAPALTLIPNPDILATLAQAGPRRPRLVIGFAAETERVVEHATAKLARKGCDWIVANDVSPATGIMGGASERGASGQRRRGGSRGRAWPRREVAGPAGRSDRGGAGVNVELRVLDARLHEWGLPTYQSDHAAAIDLHACLDAPLEIAPGSAGRADPGRVRAAHRRSGRRGADPAAVGARAIRKGWCSATWSG